MLNATSTGAAREPSAELAGLIAQSNVEPTAIAAFLDQLAHAARVDAVRGLSAKSQRLLYEAADGVGRLTLADLVPEGTPPLQPVRHYGMNSLLAFRKFEKRFYRTPGGAIAGANFQAISALTGPGYFVVRQDDARGELLVDYTKLPDVAPDGWPAIAPNDRGRSRLIYGFMVDTLRRVSQHVTIGSAARHGKPLGSYFILCREAGS